MDEKKIKHLEFILQVINRMNMNSFLLKGWSVTLATTLFAIATKNTNLEYALITYVSTLIFWFLDGYFLSKERQYRGLYDHIRKQKEENIDFDMNIKSFNIGKNKWLRSVVSTSLLLFYGVLIIVTIIVTFMLN